ncbi:MAG: hypothetical protein DHS20C11_17110 [Lysobacteraceae bacterium]|nr:MAG: hypothetical protein DHS20C11_17110 [Xanthomonadaceae bacterium]
MSKIELIIHAGAGKTGSTAIQQALGRNQGRLEKQGACYCGLVFDRVGAPRKPGVPISEEFDGKLRLGPEAFGDYLRSQLAGVQDYCKQHELQRAIWSNEAIFSQVETVGPALRRLSDDFNLRFVAFVRRQDYWFLSAYKQWGIRHKNYSGVVQDFETWYQRFKPNGDFSKTLAQWESYVGIDRMDIRVYDKTDDVLSDFLSLIGIDGSGFTLANDRGYQSPPPSVLALYKIFNSQFEDSVHPEALSRALERTKLLGFPTKAIQPDLGLPNRTRLEAILTEFADSNRSLERYSKREYSVAFPSDSMRRDPSEDIVDSDQLVASLLLMLVEQDKRLQRCEARLRKLEDAQSTP